MGIRGVESSAPEVKKRRMATLYVGNLAWNVTSDMLRGTFEQIGTVQDAEVIYHQDSGRSKGWGTVAFATQEDAQDAIQRFGGVELASRPMVVRMDRFN